MREVLEGLVERQRVERRGPQHAGLAYERYAPPKAGATKDALKPWEDWLSWLDGSREPEGYAVAFTRWKDTLRQTPTVWFTARAEGRVLVGHGNASPTGVGLTLHHTWGVPVLSGSALKGLLSGYVRAVFDAKEVEETCHRLFGVREGAGEVLFHDALWVSRRTGADEGPAMLARDVLTVHQRTWYEGRGWPNDHDAPNPVAFLSVRPGSRFLVALGLAPGAGADGAELLRWAAARLSEALKHWGIGGKTAAGYGRLEREGDVEVLTPRPVFRRSPLLGEFQAWLAGRREEKTEHQRVLDLFEAEWLARLLPLTGPEREACAQAVRSLVKSPKRVARREALLERLAGGAACPGLETRSITHQRSACPPRREDDHACD
ncbi:type III-B CRISPR module RAMP protein Cmr6 [Myxococcus sp. RHSTA-1-4]|uniref:type III-B CRISPR module RAMP protein Cmr6 n=1 Tax=Myxococcus sp. RHSTA-1-4 TaxID=2874601 RepID=UPI001CBEC1B4|nr:type III-B CRISPR module RAMP protein Cmr6 [Myxococcus sp. RHSTA-1-4]MBZ4423281.1 type III-B CRISPR module RAMP protein Cmr6 [Myxococcus sp. RHSTA-1-4]